MGFVVLTRERLGSLWRSSLNKSNWILIIFVRLGQQFFSLWIVDLTHSNGFGPSTDANINSFFLLAILQGERKRGRTKFSNQIHILDKGGCTVFTLCFSLMCLFTAVFFLEICPQIVQDTVHSVYIKCFSSMWVFTAVFFLEVLPQIFRKPHIYAIFTNIGGQKIGLL